MAEEWEGGDARIVEAVARDAIRDLVARYNHYGDRGDVESVASLFAVDGVLDVAMSGDARVASGRPEIAGLLRGVAADWAADVMVTEPRWIRHFVSTHVIDLVSSTRATGSAHVLVLRPTGIESVARYFDTYTWRDGHWLFEHRRARRDAMRVPLATTPTALTADGVSRLGPRASLRRFLTRRTQ